MIYNTVSPRGIEILPKKAIKKAEIRECIHYSGYV
jgi:hypothetical protein